MERTIIITTSPEIPYYKIIEIRGVIAEETILGANIFQNLFAGARDMSGGYQKP